MTWKEYEDAKAAAANVANAKASKKVTGVSLWFINEPLMSFGSVKSLLAAAGAETVKDVV